MSMMTSHPRDVVHGQSTPRRVMILHMCIDSAIANQDSFLYFHKYVSFMEKILVQKVYPGFSFFDLNDVPLQSHVN